MSTVTQNIPTFLNGISQQKDRKKFATQLKDAINTFPDYALGMLKRPGGKFISKLYNAEAFSTTMTAGTHNGTGDGSRTAGRYNSVATTGGSGSGATFNVHAQVAGEVKTFTHNGIANASRTAGTYTVDNAAGSASGTGADFTVVVDSDGICTVTLNDATGKTGGAGYNASGETITIADASLGGGGASNVVLTITAIHVLGVDVKLSSGGKGYLVGDTLSIADAVLGGGGGAAITVTITKTGTYGKWFSILRDEDEKYVGQYADDTFRIWDLTDGSLRKVDMGSDTNVPGGCNYTNMQTDVLAYNAAIADTKSKTTTLNTSQAAFQEADDGQQFTKTSLFSTNFDYDTGIGEQSQSLIDGIFQQETDNTYSVIKNGNVIGKSKEDIAGPVYKLEQTAEGSGYGAGIGVGPAKNIHISAAGSGYSAVAAAATSGGTGSGLTLTTTVSTGALATVTINAIGQGYKIGDELTVAGGTGGKVVIDEIITGSVYKLAVTVGGSGYSNGTGVATTGGGTALTVNTTTAAGAITAAVVNAPGNNYEIDDEITVSGGGGNAKLRVVQLGYGTTSDAPGVGAGLVVDISTDTAHKVEPEATPSDTNAIGTYTHNGVADSSRKIGHYTNVTGTASKVGTGATFDVDVDTSGVPTLTLVSGGSAYYAGETVTIADASLGSGGGAAIVVTISTTKIVKSGGAYTATTGYKIDDVITITGGGGNAKFKVSELTWQQGKELTDEHPQLAANKHKIFELIEVEPPTHTNAALTTATSAMGTAQTNYNSAVSAEATAKGNYDSEVTACTIPGLPTDGYLRGASAEDIELLTLNDYTFVLNKAKTVAMLPETTPTLPYEAFIVINVVAYNNKYECTLGGNNFSYTTVQDVTAGDADAPTIATNLRNSINAHADFTATVVGPGIYITSDSAFSATASGGSQENAIYIFQDKISDLSLLPNECYDGYKVKVINSVNSDLDDMWVKFSTTTGSFGAGSWGETNAPAITYKFDPLTMPHKLVRESDGSFKYSAVDWENRDVGDLVTNEEPSFVGSTIRNMFFFRNRFGFLSGDSVIMSKAGSFFDFWVGSAQIAAADDPIDLSASSTKPVFLNYVKTTSAGLVLFSNNEQFLLSTDSDILSPESCKINTISGYEADTDLEAVNIGTSLAFISKTPLYARLFEIFNISTVDPPVMIDSTKVIPELIPSTVDNITGSAGMSMISLGQNGTSTLYQFRFYQVSEERQAQTWYKWNLTGTLIDQFFDVSTFYAIVADGDNVYIESIELTQASDTGFLTLPTGEKTDVCMDLYKVNPYRTYNSLTDTTRVFLPFTHITGKSLAVVALGGYIGGTLGATEASVGAILYPSVAGSAGSEYVDIAGDYRGKHLIIGYIYTMTVELPKFYLRQQRGQLLETDYTSNLIIHRVKVNTGLSGPVKYNVNITGIPDRTHTVSVIQPYTYIANNVSMAADGVHDVPIYQRNENISLSIVGDTPLPVSLLGMTWEGKYNDKFYRRT